MIGEQGLTLSGGQRQRIALARALITDPAILVLDDATSAIDPRVEAQIHETLRHVMAGRTTLLIAHRRSTLQLADKIAVLDEGRLVDLGTHSELTDRCPLYRLLLAGPGDDAEGVDAGELAYYENAGSVRDDGQSGARIGAMAGAGAGASQAPPGITPGLWPGRDQRLAELDAAGSGTAASAAAPAAGRQLAAQASAAIGRGSASAPRAAAGPRRRPGSARPRTAACWPASRRPPNFWPRWRRCRRPMTSRR